MDGELLGRSEVFISWKESVSVFFASDFGLQFWRLMGASKTVGGNKTYMGASEAIDLLKSRYALVPDYFLDLKNITREGDATLVP